MIAQSNQQKMTRKGTRNMPSIINGIIKASWLSRCPDYQGVLDYRGVLDYQGILDYRGVLDYQGDKYLVSSSVLT